MPTTHQLAQTILTLLSQRAPGKTICPSEAAKAAANSTDRVQWEPLMDPTRKAAEKLRDEGKIEITQHGQPIDPATAKGPIRLRLK